jgi:energy-coupling factor transporter ATP-binding protein EcfA2
MLTQVSFQNLRALADVTLDLERFTVLVGPNGCGKSTVLDEIDRMCAMTHPQEQPGVLATNLMAAPGGHLNQEGGPPPHTSGISNPMVWRGEAPTSTFEFRILHPEQPMWWERSSLLLTQNRDRFRLGPLGEKADLNNPLAKEANERLRHSYRWRAQRLAPQRLMLLLPSPFEAMLDQLDPAGYGLATNLLHMAANSIEDYAALQEDLRSVVPHFERLHVRQANVIELQKARQANPGYVIDLTFRGAGRIPANQASEGTLFALTVLAALHGPEMPSLILMDDIDHGLHLSAQYQIIRVIRRVMERRPELQVICTTHSPILLDSFEPKEVRVMALDKGGHTRVRPLTDLPDFEKHRRGLQTGELWASTGEDWVAEGGPNG